jgi:hypothetical protein
MAIDNQSAQYGQLPFDFINGFGIENNPYTPNTGLVIFYGRTLDSNFTYQLTMPSATALFIDSSIIGIGGLDKGPLLANKIYGVYVAWDPIGSNEPSAFISSSYYHPTIQFGYDAVKLVGYVATDASKNFRPAKWNRYGSASYRNFIYTPSVAVLQNGTASTETKIDLISYIPNIEGQIVNLELSFTSSTPGNSLTVYSDMGSFDLYAQAASIPNTSLTNLVVTKQVLLTGVISPVISYSVTNAATDSASIYCNGYDFFL